LLLLATSELRLDLLKMSSDCVFVILADEVDKTVNFVEISVEVVEPILEV
jgi:hypothetical protein